MKKMLGIMTAIAITFFMAAQSHAVLNLNNTLAGTGINNVNLNATIGVKTFQFSPSPQVWLDGQSFVSKFVAAAVHNQAMGTGGGKAYGMAYDATAVFWMSSESMVAGAAPTLVAAAASDSTEFAAWKK